MNNLTRENLPALLPFKDDLIFKTMLTHPGADLMRNSIISAFTGLKIVESDVMQNEPGLDMSYAEKPIRFDVTCTTDTGKRVNIEMQAHRMEGDNAANAHENLRCRSIYYTSKLFVMQTAARYSELNQTFHIMICDYTVFDDEKFLHRFVYADGGLKLTDICSIIYVELPKIKDRLQKPFEQMTDDERWAVLIEYANDDKFKTKAAEFESREEYNMAMKALNRLSQDEIIQIQYLNREIAQMDYNTGMYEAEKRGLQQGLQQGIQQGLQQANLATARMLLSMKMSTEDIAKATSLPIETIRAIEI